MSNADRTSPGCAPLITSGVPQESQGDSAPASRNSPETSGDAWAEQDSNLQQDGYEPSALTIELSARATRSSLRPRIRASGPKARPAFNYKPGYGPHGVRLEEAEDIQETGPIQIFVVRMVVDQQLVGIYAAPTIRGALDEIDEVVDPFLCEYARVERLGIGWGSRTYAVPYRDIPEGEEIDHAWNWSHRFERELETAQWKPIADRTVYFIRAGDAVKIGVARDPRARLSELQVGSAARLEIVRLVPGDERTERGFHRRFDQHHLRGEWFRIEGELAAFLKITEEVQP